MQSVIHKANTRGHANYGWLDTNLTFSFANYYNKERHNFGVLRVLNDDYIKPGTGFDTHPHNNMEIISIPISGTLEHKDSMGNTFAIRKNDVQIMSAGTGVLHSEYSVGSENEESNFLQIWLIPKEKNITPRYSQKTFAPEDRLNQWQEIVSPGGEKGVSINQDAFLHLINLRQNKSTSYELKINDNGVYFFVISGNVKIENDILDERDGIGIWETDRINLNAIYDAEILAIEVPMIRS